MTSHSEPNGARSAGYSLLEMMIVLAILSLAVAGAVRLARGPSPAVQLDAFVSQLRLEASQSRLTAIRTQQMQTLAIDSAGDDIVLCDLESEARLLFFPDGSVTAAEICVSAQDLQIVISSDPLTGLITSETQAATQ